MFALLDGISPWWWVTLAIGLAALEMLTISTLLIWSAGGALVVAIVLWLWPGLGAAGQIALFAVCSIGFTFVGRSIVARMGEGPAGAKNLNRRAEQLVGREAVVDSFAGSEGQVTVDGVPWPARLEPGAGTPVPGARVRITAVDGIVVRVTSG